LLLNLNESYHICCDNWKIYSDRDSYINVREAGFLLKDRLPVLVSHSDIGWKGMEPFQKYDQRYLEADYSLPGILALDVKNPYNRKYRMVDGGHRIAKMVAETGITESYYYILTKAEFYQLLLSY
tara:strand:- start:5630 stop:6004 length:375 start_codon:yes stop_codon:yes gene_type:complete